MGTHYGTLFYGTPITNGKFISTEEINSIILQNATITSFGNNSNTVFEISIQHTSGGCGVPDSGIYIQLKDFIPWKYMAVTYEVRGGAACWWFDEGGEMAVTPNILTYDETKGDKIIQDYYGPLSDPAFATHQKTIACDNQTDNFMRYNTGVIRKIRYVRRRNVNGSLSGVHCERSCSGITVNDTTSIKNIFVWY